MTDDTLCIAIDLGTTSAKMACWHSGSVEIIPNHEGANRTPCAVWLAPQDCFVVGRRAHHALFTDSANVGLHFIRNLGTGVEYTFSRSSHHFRPEDLAAELLKSLRADAERFTGREIKNVVITIPPDAGVTQWAAVKRAASAAGFEHCLLLQDAIGAALAAGITSEANGKMFLIYDFGGSRFSASVLRARDGVFQVVASASDSFLGGADLDRAVVESVFVPALRVAYPDLDVSASNQPSRALFAKLQAEAEEAKFRLTSVHDTTGFVPALYKDDSARPIDFEYELTRSRLESLAAPLVDKTIDLCSQVLADARVSGAEVSNVILVGGMAAMPFVQRRLVDRFGQRAIPESSFDSRAAAARGAAIFAASQRLPVEIAPTPNASCVEGAESPDTRGMACIASALSHAIGLVLEGNRVVGLFEKGTALPTRQRISLRTSVALKRGQSGDVLRLTLVEGDSDHANRNREIGVLSVPFETVARDLPAGTEVEVTVEIDEYRQFGVSTYIPILDAGFETSLALFSRVPSRRELSERFERTKARLKAAQEGAKEHGQSLLLQKAQTTLEGGVVTEIQELLLSAEREGDISELCASRLNELESIADDLEKSLEWPVSVEDFKQRLAHTRDLLKQSRQPTDARIEALADLERTAATAIDHRSIVALKKCSERLDSLHSRALQDEPGFWIGYLEHLIDRKSELRNAVEGEVLIGQARRALSNNDPAAFQQVVRSLLSLFPPASRSTGQVSGLVFGGGTADRVAHVERR
ncbi:MAG: Hsp70 family protein [Deltaproteobacteria bacterium]|nr:Hsp70 family protein [Deltaproteobacteria bacterium]